MVECSGSIDILYTLARLAQQFTNRPTTLKSRHSIVRRVIGAENQSKIIISTVCPFRSCYMQAQLVVDLTHSFVLTLTWLDTKPGYYYYLDFGSGFIQSKFIFWMHGWICLDRIDEDDNGDTRVLLIVRSNKFFH